MALKFPIMFLGWFWTSLFFHFATSHELSCRYTQHLIKNKKKKKSIITESLNHSHRVVVRVGKNLWRLFSSIPLLKQGHPEHIAWDCIQVGFEYSQRRRLQRISAQPVPVLYHPHSKVSSYSDVTSCVLVCVHPILSPLYVM